MSQPTIYYEVRMMHNIFGPPMPIASDIARHLQSRQYLGTTVVVCENPHSMLSALRKQWLRLARNLQKQRASTLNAEEILRFTHTIMHMQHLQFVAHTPVAESDGHIFFVRPDELSDIPAGCLSLYITTPPRASRLKAWIASLGSDALVIDYEGNLELNTLGLAPKKDIELRMRDDWRELCTFLREHNVEVNELTNGMSLTTTAMDHAVDNLLVSGNTFLRRAAEFQHMVSLAQPIKDSTGPLLKQIEAVMRVAHRVQSLTPGSFGSFLMHAFGESRAESFFLRDATPDEDSQENYALLPTLTHEYSDTATFMVYV